MLKYFYLLASYYCPANDSFTEGIECPMGHYCPIGTHQQNRHPCPPGTFNPHTRMSSHEDCLPCPPGTITSNSGNLYAFSQGFTALFFHSIWVAPFQLLSLVLTASVKTHLKKIYQTLQDFSASLLDRVLRLDHVQLDTSVFQEPCPLHLWMEKQVAYVLRVTTVP